MIQNNNKLIEILEGINKRAKKKNQAATYFPTPVQEQYHRP